MTADMSPVLVTRRGAVLLLTLNRPDVRNALSADVVSALHAEVRAAEADPDVRAVVLTGAGRAFSAGADLRALQTLGAASSEANKADSQALADLLSALYTSRKPVVAAVEGAAVAGGAGLASACDVVVAGASAKFGYTEVKLGFVAAIVMVFLLRVVGEKHARELLLTGRLVDAREAWRVGLVNEVVEDGAALTRALEVAEEIASNSATALATTKEMLALVPGMGLAEGLRYAVGVNAWTRTTSDLKEGVAAFLEKRAPNWPRGTSGGE
ncbi:enoyl-CoA hydratase/isomerase family protein [Deinococcus maricopensis]|uniref:Enoyl-CoA hydratase/isomerase n=1 Tax=Deinococcus maricopensis (strain DSM 21211 / LMG 22137 / NRRL B-23946 / LB-34) TaxID=709986 RepID=E8UBK7_DEIML|nr:enoyl-CoA hydratase-related protein [Deinococcus maricopensis]ADV68446.1 Enoyl-CoA hydratase/isomerase [Deinococcus maricopensis DSM 21211]